MVFLQFVLFASLICVSFFCSFCKGSLYYLLNYFTLLLRSTFLPRSILSRSILRFLISTLYLKYTLWPILKFICNRDMNCSKLELFLNISTTRNQSGHTLSEMPKIHCIPRKSPLYKYSKSRPREFYRRSSQFSSLIRFKAMFPKDSYTFAASYADKLPV